MTDNNYLNRFELATSNAVAYMQRYGIQEYNVSTRLLRGMDISLLAPTKKRIRQLYRAVRREKESHFAPANLIFHIESRARKPQESVRTQLENLVQEIESIPYALPPV